KAGQVAAVIDNATVTAEAGNVTVESRAEAQLLNITAGGAGAGKVALAGSIAINFMQHDLLARIGGGAQVSANAAEDGAQTGHVFVSASVAPIMINIAGAAAGAGAVGLAGASATNDMASIVSARIDGSATRVTADGNVDVQARLLRVTDGVPQMNVDSSLIPEEEETGDRPATPEQGDQIWSFALSGAGAGKVAVSGALSLNWLRSNVEAVIDAAEVTAEGDVRVAASDDLGLNAFTVAASGAGAFAAAGYFAYNYVGGNPDNPADDASNRIAALIQNGANVTAGGSVLLEATSDSRINAYTIGGAVAGFAALSGTTTLNFTRKEIRAEVLGGATRVEAGEHILIEAEDSSRMTSASVQVNVAVKGGAAGISVVYHDIQNRIVAGSQGAELETRQHGGGDVVIRADSLSSNLITSAGVTYGTFGAGAANAGSSVIRNLAEARVDGGTVRADGTLLVHADVVDTSRIVLGTVAAGAVAIGGGVSVDLMGSDSRAWIGGNADVLARGNGDGRAVTQRWDDGWKTENHKGVVVLATSHMTFLTVAAT
ncbi:MAG: hypothetical protein ACRC3F_09255, partial [Billgrantia desiderata]